MYIWYIYSPNWEELTQVHNIYSVNVSLKINDVWSGEFFINSDNPANTLEFIREFNWVKIFKQDSITGVEKLLIEWFIKVPEAQNNGTNVQVWDMNDFLKNRYIWTTKNYTGQTLDYILSDVLSDFQGRYDNGFTLDCGVTDILPDKTYPEGQDILSIFQDLTEEWYEFHIRGNIIYFKTQIGIDRTVSWEEYLEYNYDVENPQSKNIENPKTLFNSENIANSVKVKDGASIETQTDPTSISSFGAIERFFTSSGKDTDTASEILNKRKNSTREISFTPISRDFFEADIGDMVRVYINSSNILNNFIWSVKILEKRYQSWDLESISITTSTGEIKTLWFFAEIQKIKRDQKILQL